MRSDAHQPDAADEPSIDGASGRPILPAIARGARLFATPAAIVVAWFVVVTQWDSSDEQLFNWATTAAGIVLGVVTGAWLISLKFPALRRALMPFEGGLVVGAIVLAVATTGREVDMLGDRIAIALAFGIIAALLLAFMQQLVAGRRRARAWLGAVVVICIAAGIAVPAVLDWLEGDMYLDDYPIELGGEVIARASEDGFRLDDISIRYTVAPLATGYFDDAAVAGGGVYPEPAVGMSTGPIAGAAPSAPMEPLGPNAVAADPVPSILNDWARLVARSDGSIRLVVTPGIAGGVDGRVVGSLRQGSCREGADATELAAFHVLESGTTSIKRDLPIAVKDLRLDDQLSLVIGTERLLGPTRCLELLTSSGIALAQLGAARFIEDCVEPLDLPRGSEYQVRASSFQDQACARRFEAYSGISNSLLLSRTQLKAWRECHRSRESGIATTERRLPHGAVAVTYPGSSYGDCYGLGANAATYGGHAAPMPDPAMDSEPGMATAVGPTASTVPPGAVPAPPAPIEDLDGLTPEELSVRVR